MKQNTSKAVVQEIKKTSIFKRAKPRIFVIFGFVVLLAGIASSIVYLQKDTQTGYTCDESVRALAKQAIDSNDIEKLQTIAKDITSNEGYKDDVNCTYILVHAEISSGNVVEAKELLEITAKNEEKTGKSVDKQLVPDGNVKEAPLAKQLDSYIEQNPSVIENGGSVHDESGYRPSDGGPDRNE